MKKPDALKSDQHTIKQSRQRLRQYDEKVASKVDAKRNAAEKLNEAQVKSTSTISLGFFGFGERTMEEKKNLVSTPPKGIPVLSSWKQNTDGSISGLISGSSAYDTGDAITTSPIVGNALGGAVVQTRTGSKYVFHIRVYAIFY